MKTTNAGFHVHVYFDANTKSHALSVYHAVSQAFPKVQIGRINDRPIGPHTKPMFQMTLQPDMFGPVVTWLMFNRTGLSVLVHPISGDELADHTQHMLWLGLPVALDINKL